jgi:hypothetical protein
MALKEKYELKNFDHVLKMLLDYFDASRFEKDVCDDHEESVRQDRLREAQAETVLFGLAISKRPGRPVKKRIIRPKDPERVEKVESLKEDLQGPI